MSAYGQGVDGEDCVGGATAVRNVSGWCGCCASQPGVSPLGSADCEGVAWGVSVERNGL